MMANKTEIFGCSHVKFYFDVVSGSMTSIKDTCYTYHLLDSLPNVYLKLSLTRLVSKNT